MALSARSIATGSGQPSSGNYFHQGISLLRKYCSLPFEFFHFLRTGFIPVMIAGNKIDIGSFVLMGWYCDCKICCALLFLLHCRANLAAEINIFVRINN